MTEDKDYEAAGKALAEHLCEAMKHRVESLFLKPTKLIIQPALRGLAIRLMRRCMFPKRKQYLKRRGARK